MLVISNPFFVMNKFCFIVMIIGSIYPGVAPSYYDAEADVYNVLHYGAIGFDFIDNSQAFLRAWDAACNAETGTPTVVIPENMAFLVFPVTFQGPCKPDKITFMVSGKIVAPSSTSFLLYRDSSQWLAFQGVKGLTVDGYGTIDGRGDGWWYQSCKLSPALEGCTTLAPTALKFIGCNESSVSNILFTNSPQTHVLIMHCYGFRVDKLTIQSPGDSPNTDGIHIQASRHLDITNSKISSGDDCISVGDYTSHIEISNITCGPGHGISIGSLGRKGNFVQVRDIRVTNSFFNGTTNGARIKTWQVGKGYVRHITFRNLQFVNVNNPIIIDQYYCEVRGACKEQGTGVRISNVTYMTMSGTSSSPIAINLNCSRSVHCTDILMQSIQLASATSGEQVKASCINAQGQEIDVVPGPCLPDTTSTSTSPTSK